ncbi:TrkH family potassium uptake protein, partial [Pelagibacteraceae bacterium]|nr:TrkH family potassium uptake protein [Pelagibacteraceae bacterium]
MNHKSILFFLGVYSIFVSFFSFLNILYSIYFNFILDLNSYVITLITSLLIGSYFCFIGRKHHTNITISGQIVFILLSFVLIPLLISIPYYLSIYNISFLNSYFESVSGITSTGFSIIENINNIDEPLLLWRSSSQWLGGLFFLVAVIGTIGSKQIKIKPAYLLPGGVLGRNLYNNFNYNFIRILLIYFFSTVFIIFLYSLSNIRLFDAFNLAFTVISSGGFVNSSNLNNILSNDFQIFILSITLLIPILNFFLFYNFLIRRFEIKNHYEDVHLLGIVILLS